MKVSGCMINVMVKVLTIMKMVDVIKVYGKTMKKVVKELFILEVEIDMKVNGNMVNRQAKG